MDKLMFLSNKLQSPEHQKELNIPLTFVAFGITEGRMYKHFHSENTFIIPINSMKRWGNNVVYGGLFLCKDFDFYSRLLDAYHMCSMSTLHRNHTCDIHHRVNISVTPIRFNTLDELSRLKYKEGEPIEVQTYMGNIKHPRITQRLRKTVSYRIIDGIDADNFKKLFGR